MKPLILTSAPHIKSKSTLQQIMYDVALALAPVSAWSIYLFGWKSVVVIVTAIASGLVFEAAALKIQKKAQIMKTVFDGSAIVTSLLLALNMPPASPIWLTITGSFVAIIIGKHTFGGLGYNIFNPALVARVFLLISFPMQMTRWISPNGFNSEEITVATPLDVLKVSGLQKMQESFNMNDLFNGYSTGSLGEMSELLLLIGAAYLFFRKVITWEIPVSMLLGLFLFTGAFYLVDPLKYASPFFHMVTGGAILGAFFMATDMVTSPITRKGMLIFGAMTGIITGIIRILGSYPEGVSFAIIMMNAFVPLIDRYTKVIKIGSDKKR